MKLILPSAVPPQKRNSLGFFKIFPGTTWNYFSPPFTIFIHLSPFTSNHKCRSIKPPFADFNHIAHYLYFYYSCLPPILIPRDHARLGEHQKSQPLAGPTRSLIPELPIKSVKADWLRIGNECNRLEQTNLWDDVQETTIETKPEPTNDRKQPYKWCNCL